MSQLPLVHRLAAAPTGKNDRGDQLDLLGGKGASLARLSLAGLPVPDGFVITTVGYRQFVVQHDLGAPIADLAAQADPEQASARIQELIMERALPEAVRSAALESYAVLGAGPVAVRSSATAEDLPGLSFAGQQDTVLNVSGPESLLRAILRCWASLWNARAIAYRREHRVDEAHLALAVVVQRLVEADAAGVLFTADPVSHSAEVIVIESAWGLGEAVVSGRVNPDRFRIEAHDHRLLEQTTGEKSLMTVPVPGGVEDRTVPPERARVSSLSPGQAGQLSRLGARVAELYRAPVDVEWCRRGDDLFLLQARPITVGSSDDPWNDSRGVHCLWTSGNVGEAIPDTMTPATWCLVREFLADAMPTSGVPPYVAFGVVGGRLYLNLSMAASIARCAGIGERLFRSLTHDVFGRLSDDLAIPYLKLPPARVLRLVMPVALSMTVHAQRDARRLPGYLRDHPERCRSLRAQIAATTEPDRLARLWTETIHPEFHRTTRMLTAATRSGGPSLVTVRRSLQRMVGHGDAERLLAGLGRDHGPLASLGPLVGLEHLADGEIDAAAFRDLYGHRGPHEFEISIPRPAEDPGWLARTVAEQRSAEFSVSELLHRQGQARSEAWQRVTRDHPHRAARVRTKIQHWVELSRRREEARSEVVRFFWVLRAFWLRAGELSGVGDQVFSYDRNEVVALLGGRPLDPDVLQRRQEAYRAYCALPPYPTMIIGTFDPFDWAADPDRAAGVFVEGGSEGDEAVQGRSGDDRRSDTVTGFPGSGGRVEGIVRVLTSTEQSDRLGAGDILVTSVTNVGWTPLFPMVRAVVTDVGAPLSHAAIVARELGIPAVVGCGDATARLHTGDLVRVDGGAGTVEVLQRA